MILLYFCELVWVSGSCFLCFVHHGFLVTVSWAAFLVSRFCCCCFRFRGFGFSVSWILSYWFVRRCFYVLRFLDLHVVRYYFWLAVSVRGISSRASRIITTDRNDPLWNGRQARWKTASSKLCLCVVISKCYFELIEGSDKYLGMDSVNPKEIFMEIRNGNINYSQKLKV